MRRRYGQVSFSSSEEMIHFVYHIYTKRSNYHSVLSQKGVDVSSETRRINDSLNELVK